MTNHFWQLRQPRILLLASFCLLTCALCICCSGCAALGVAANAIPQNVKARYAGLKGQTVGIIVWADRGIMIDWGPLQLDLANAIQNKLAAAKTDETKAMTFPYEPKSYLRYMRDHPGSDAMPITEIAPKLGITRLIYVEVRQFQTRSQREIELFRGDATASLQIIEIDPARATAKIAYTEDDLHAIYPKNAPEDGEPSIGDSKTYSGEVDALAEKIVGRLASHEEERN